VDSLQTIEQKRDHYHQEMTRRTPPRSRQDEYMRNVYEGLLQEIEWYLIIGGSPRAEVPKLKSGSEDKLP
jgi:uncharacterized membrane protein